jgi:hypothetical protein
MFRRTTSIAMPAQILLFRHAEKPESADDWTLSLKGQIRAAALAMYLPDVFGRPSHLVAAKRSKDSDRPRLTLQPLSDALHLPIDLRFEHDQFKDLAHELLTDPRYHGARIALCWHHGEIPALARELQARDAPDDWHDDTFDRIWQIDYGVDQPKLTKVHQKLLYRDGD